MKAWTAYAGASLVLVAACAGLAGAATGGAATRAIWLSAGLAWVLQLIAFALLVGVRRQASLFMFGWVGGMGLRFLTLGVLAYFGTRSTALPAEPLLISFVAFLVGLILLEPVFLKRGPRAS